MQIWCELFNQRGSSLLFVIVLITILTISFGIILLMFSMQQRSSKQYQFEIQARYNAESGIYCAIDTLQQNLSITWDEYPYLLSWGDTTYISINQFGGFIEVISRGVKKGKQTTLRILLGEIPSDDFNYALYVADDRSHVTFTGDCQITGNIKVGKIGTQIRPFKGSQFTGKINGVVYTDEDILLPELKSDFYQELISQYDKYLIIPPSPYIYFKQTNMPDPALNNRSIYYSEDNIELNESYEKLISKRATFISKKDIILKDSITFAYGSTFIAANSINIQNEVNGINGIFYAQNEIMIQDSVNCSGQFIAEKEITLSDFCKLGYPSVLYLNGTELMGERTGDIELNDFSYLGGTIIYPSSSSFGIIDKGKIFICKTAVVNGAIYSSNQIDFNGTLYGSLVTNQTYFYHSPAHYINWLRTGGINILKKEKYFCLPLGFSENPKLDIIYYEEL